MFSLRACYLSWNLVFHSYFYCNSSYSSYPQIEAEGGEHDPMEDGL